MNDYLRGVAVFAAASALVALFSYTIARDDERNIAQSKCVVEQNMSAEWCWHWANARR